MLTRSRAVATAVAIAVARSAAALVFALVSAASTVISRRPASLGAVFALRKSVNR